MRRPVFPAIVVATLAAVGLPALLGLVARSRRPGPSAFDPADDEIDLAVVFEGADLRSEADSFDGGDLLVWFGGLRLDLSAARIDPSGARLRVRCVGGGLELVVPDDCRVVVAGRGRLGAVDDHTDGEGLGLDEAAEEAPLLEIEALAVLGGIGIGRRDPE